MAKSRRSGPWQRLLERYCRVLGLLLVIEKLRFSSSDEYYRVFLTSPDSAFSAHSDASSSYDNCIGSRLVPIKKKDGRLADYIMTYDTNAERACKKHLLEMLGSDIEIWKDGRGVEADFLAHVPDSVDALKVHLDLAEGSRESC